jgi:hypothetical protein
MTPLYWLFVILVLAMTAFLGYGTFATARLLRTWQPEGNLLLMPGENVLRLGMVALCVGLGWLSGLPLAELGWTAPGAAGQVLWGVGIGGAVAGFFIVTTRWLVQRTGMRFYSDQVIGLIVPKSGRELLLVGLALMPVVVLEELLFRSLLLGGLSPILPVAWLLVGFGVIFGLLHSPQGAWGMVGAGLAGILFGLLFLWQGSLLLPIVAHYVANFVQIAVAMQLNL